ncbi:MAG: DAK2 domain-containing protein [Clostridiaceae bacterium]|nr:DAK2 domain-containing protein [Clostridiaceae bacterium]
MEFIKIDGHHFYNMVINACNRLEEQKEYVNALNVFPVPDGDTGTNMSMTFKAAVKEIENLNSNSIGEVSKVLAKGALMGARGNSGVILSQILRGIAHGFEGKVEATGSEVANSFLEGSKAAYKAVMRPTEGTILTVIRAAGESGIKSTETDVVSLMKEICEHSEIMLNKTQEMLPVLKSAKVVDAGGMGLYILIKGMYEALRDNLQGAVINNEIESKKYAPIATLGEQDIKYGYCTEFFVKADESHVEKFKYDLEPHGDSMIVVGAEDIIKVHIHTNDPGLVLSKAVVLGELTKIKIENMRDQHRHLLFNEEEIVGDSVTTDVKAYAFISVAMGEGIKNIFSDLGVDYVIEGGQTMNPSTQDILDCISKVNAESIFILPNNKNIIMAATQASELTDKKVMVVPTKTIPQGITCLTTFNPEVTAEENLSSFSEAIKNVSTCTVTYAVRDTEMDGIEIKEGNILGLVEGKINTVGEDMFEVCDKIISNVVKDVSGLITLFYGIDCDEEKVAEFVQTLEEKYPDLDVQSYNGKQPLYYFIASVE